MPSAGFEPAIPATKRPQTYALDSAATGIGAFSTSYHEIYKVLMHATGANVCLV
jgi:hypothetical protein